ncbi:hypothetical protein EV176_002962, partial [Coemansia sp. RSA 451]
MSQFSVPDITKPGSVDVSNGITTLTLNYHPHLVEACGCSNCKNITKSKADAAAKKAAEEQAMKTHLVDKCACDICKGIMAQKAEETKKAAEAKKKAEEDAMKTHLVA